MPPATSSRYQAGAIASWPPSHDRCRRRAIAAQTTPADAPVGLPSSLVRLVGRDSVVAAISAQLRQRRLVTLVGTGGIGKTTVAVAAARALSSSFHDGVGFVDLAKIGDPSLMASALAAVLGLSVHSDNPLPGVLAFLRHKQMLLVLDNCEHVVEAAAATAEDVLNAAPGVRILATSREPLRAAEERVHRLASAGKPIRVDRAHGGGGDGIFPASSFLSNGPRPAWTISA